MSRVNINVLDYKSIIPVPLPKSNGQYRWCIAWESDPQIQTPLPDNINYICWAYHPNLPARAGSFKFFGYVETTKLSRFNKIKKLFLTGTPHQLYFYRTNKHAIIDFIKQGLLFKSRGTYRTRNNKWTATRIAAHRIKHPIKLSKPKKRLIISKPNIDIPDPDSNTGLDRDQLEQRQKYPNCIITDIPKTPKLEPLDWN